MSWKVKPTQKREVNKNLEIKIKFETEGNLESEENKNNYKEQMIPKTTKNNALRFSQYTLRKDIVKTDAPHILSYINQTNIPNEVKKGGLYDFNNHQKRNFNEVFGLKGIPSGGDYNPKYHLIQKNFINLDKYKNAELKRKKNLLRKLWKSNSSTIEFQIVKFE